MTMPNASGKSARAANPESEFNRTLAVRTEKLSASHVPLAGLSVDRLRAGVSPDRFAAQVNPSKDSVLIPYNVSRSELVIESRKLTANHRPGQFTLVPRGSVTNGHCYTPSEFAHLLIDETCVQKVNAELDGPSRIDLLPFLQGKDELLRQLAHTLISELANGAAADTLYTEILARALVAHLLKRYGISAATPGGDSPLTKSSVGCIVDYVAANLADKISIEDLAKATGVSASKLNRQFKRATGASIHQYVIGERVKRAKELLLGSKLRVADIAQQTGFADQSHLTRMLRKLTGLTPTEFR